MPPFTQSFTYPYPFVQTAQSLFQKYPNPDAAHVVSVDTLSSTLSEDGTLLRTERLIGVSQSAPKWMMKLVGAQEEAYVREITFVSLPLDGTPSVLQASVNLSLSSLVKCIERISYRPSKHGYNDPFTVFQQKAIFQAQGRLTQGVIGQKLGKKVEENSWERFDSNAHAGRRGFLSVLQRMWPEEKAKVGS